MIRPFILLLAACASAVALNIPSTLTVDGQIYTGVVYKSHDASRLRIKHDTGAAGLLISKLPAELQAKLGYDANAANAAEIAANEQLQQAVSAQAERDRRSEMARTLASSAIAINTTVFQVVPDGVLIESVVSTPGIITDSKEVSAGNLLHPDKTKTIITKREGLVSKRLGPSDYVFIRTDKAFVDGSEYTGVIYPIGSHSYTTAIGGLKTVAAFTDIPEVAMRVHGLQ